MTPVDPHSTMLLLMAVGTFGVLAAAAFVVKCAK
jgi:hypothetical protein